MFGTFRDRGIIRPDTRATNDPQPSYTTALYSDVPCEIAAVGGVETFRGRQLEAGVDYVVTCHYLPNVEPTMQFEVTGGIFDGRLLNIARILPQVNRGRATLMDLYCSSLEA